MSVPEWFKKAIKNKPLSRFIKVKGVDIHYLVWGDISKPGLFLIHGYSAHAHWWDFIAPNFIDNYCVIAIDLSGMGDSEHRDSYSQELYSKEILSLCCLTRYSFLFKPIPCSPVTVPSNSKALLIKTVSVEYGMNVYPSFFNLDIPFLTGSTK